MKIIKFRAWNGKYFSHPDGQWGMVCLISSENWIVEQFIGLRDKNNKEIYEGDILRSNIFPENLLATVKYLDDRGWFIWSIKKGIHGTWSTFGDFLDDGCWCEVIGNIHENPELLKEQNDE